VDYFISLYYTLAAEDVKQIEKRWMEFTSNNAIINFKLLIFIAAPMFCVITLLSNVCKVFVYIFVYSSLKVCYVEIIINKFDFPDFPNLKIYFVVILKK